MTKAKKKVAVATAKKPKKSKKDEVATEERRELDVKVKAELSIGTQTPDDLADALGVSLAEVTDSLRRLEVEGIVRVDGDEIFVLDMAAVEQAFVDEAAGSVVGGASALDAAAVALADTLTPPDAATDAATEKKPAPVPTRYLSCKLSKRDKRLRGERISQNFQRIAELDGEITYARESIKDKKAELLTLDKFNRRSAAAIYEGSEFRDVPVIERRNDEAVTIETVRLDTNEVIESRTMTGKERQGELFPATEPAPTPTDVPAPPAAAPAP